MEILLTAFTNIVDSVTIFSIFNYLYINKKLPNHLYLKYLSYYFIVRGINISLRIFVESLGVSFFPLYSAWYSVNLIFLVFASESYGNKKHTKYATYLIILRTILVIIGLKYNIIVYYIGLFISVLIYLYVICNFSNKNISKCLPCLGLIILLITDLELALDYNSIYFIASNTGILLFGVSTIINHLGKIQVERDEALIENTNLRSLLASLDNIEANLKTLAKSFNNGK